LSDINRCLGCMAEKTEQPQCPHCGWQHDGKEVSLMHIPPGTILTEKYLIGRPLGQGGFGITYLAYDLNLKIKLAIKEFFPQGLISRVTGTSEITVYSSELKDQYEFGLDKFLNEAQILARFEEHPGIVTVRDFFRANGTAYMVMSYIEGITLEEYLKQQGGKISFNDVLNIMMPVMDALNEVHGSGIMHRDISPDNVVIDAKGRVVLIDFGAARQDLRERSKSLSVILKPGYAPEEQYRSKGEQGPWTDIYALGATMYRAVTGVIPPDSLDRIRDDVLDYPQSISDNPSLLNAFKKALAVYAEDRFQTVSQFQKALQQDDYYLQDNINELQKDKKNAVERKVERESVVKEPANDLSPVYEKKEKSKETNKTNNWIIVTIIVLPLLVYIIGQLSGLWQEEFDYSTNGKNIYESENDVYSSPEKVVDAYFEAFKDKDFRTALNFTVDGDSVTDSDLEVLESVFMDFNIVDYSLGKTDQISSTEVNVPVSITSSLGGEVSYSTDIIRVVKLDGKWYLDENSVEDDSNDTDFDDIDWDQDNID